MNKFLALPPCRDYRDLARAAVDGDQAALDTLATKKSRPQPKEPTMFFVGTNKGNVYIVTDRLRKACSTDEGIARMLHSHEHNILIVITITNIMTQYNIQQIQTQSEVLVPTHSVRIADWVEKFRMVISSQGKLSGRPTESDFTLIGTGLFAYVTGEPTIRMIDLASSNNVLLRLNPAMGFANNEVLVSISFSAIRGMCAR